MALFTKQIKTIKGEALAAKALGGQSMRFTRIVLGDGQLSGQSPAELEGLLGEKVSLPVAESYREDNSTWTVGAPFDNKDLSIGFYWREVGVYAQDPDEGEILFSYASAQDAPDYIPPLTGGRWEKRIYVSERVSSAANVTVDASKSVLYAPKEDLVKHVSDHNNPHKVTADQVGAAPSSHLESKGHMFPAAASLTPAGALELTGDLPADKDGLTVQFVSPAASTEGLQMKFAGSDALYPILTTGEGKEPIQAGAWDQGVPVTLTVSGGSCFFKVGAGDYGTLPPQTRITAKAGNAEIALTLQTAADSPYFGGTLLVRKEGSTPEKVSDGVKIDVGKATAYTDTGLTNDTEYHYRAFAYTPKKRYQTELTGAVAEAIPRSEPTQYQKIAAYTSNGTWTAPEDGYYQVYAIGKGGDGGDGGDYYSANGGNYGSAGGGGGGGGVACSRAYLARGSQLTIVVNSSVSSVGGALSLSATSGQKGTNGIRPSSMSTAAQGGPGGSGGTASGGTVANTKGGIGGKGGDGGKPGANLTPSPQSGTSGSGAFPGAGGAGGKNFEGQFGSKRQSSPGGGGGGSPMENISPYLQTAGKGGEGGVFEAGVGFPMDPEDGYSAGNYGGGGGGGSGMVATATNYPHKIPTGGLGAPGVVIIEKGVYN